MFSRPRDVNDFVAEFRNERDLQDALQNNDVTAPDGWNPVSSPPYKIKSHPFGWPDHIPVKAT